MHLVKQEFLTLKTSKPYKKHSRTYYGGRWSRKRSGLRLHHYNTINLKIDFGITSLILYVIRIVTLIPILYKEVKIIDDS